MVRADKPPRLLAQFDRSLRKRRNQQIAVKDDDGKDSLDKSRDPYPGGLSWYLLLLSTNITMVYQERLPWSCLVPGGPCSFPTSDMLSASQTELNGMMNEKTGKLLELRRELEKEMELRSKDFVSSHC